MGRKPRTTSIEAPAQSTHWVDFKLMEPQEHITKHRILQLLDYVKDPEIQSINVRELGAVRGVEAHPRRSFDAP